MSFEDQYAIQYNPPFRTGIVAEQQLQPFAAVRVNFPDRDNLLSYWLQIVVPKTQADQYFYMPDIGEQVVCLMDQHDEYGCVIGSVYSQEDQTPDNATNDTSIVQFSDGTVLSYDRVLHAFTLMLCASSTLNVQQSSGAALAFDTAGNVTISSPGNVTVNSSMVTLGPGAIDSFVLVSKLIAAFNTHIHPSGSGPTGPPTVPLTSVMIASTKVMVSN
jgi:phage baseplate assembly protein V